MNCPACKARWTLGPRYSDLDQPSGINLFIIQLHNLHIGCYLHQWGAISLQSLFLLALLAQMWLYTGLIGEVCRGPMGCAWVTSTLTPWLVRVRPGTSLVRAVEQNNYR